MTTTAPYGRVETDLRAIIRSGGQRDAICQAICDHLRESLPTYSWVGIYLVEGDELVLRAWSGPAATEHVRIPLNQGICGWAAMTGETVIVDDVAQDERYLQCFLNTRSEIVVPIVQAGVVYGEIDVDGDQIGAYGAADRRLLEAVCADLATIIAR
ncbi:MAG: GAF domain-containing protein [Chloroflexi bacterium]|nr:GAF domain-containing protein [Chloroflexota bacterium]